jgi:hypothetical protein
MSLYTEITLSLITAIYIFSSSSRSCSDDGPVMPHKFKIGDTVTYYPSDRMHNTARGTYTITGFMPTGGDHRPEYRIKHFSEDFERVAVESELSVA